MADRISEIRLDLSGSELVIFVDGENLLTTLQRIMDTGPAGDLMHRGLTAAEIEVGITDLLGYSRFKTELYGCPDAECGDLACWPIETHIERTQSVIRWIGLSNPHRLDEWIAANIAPLHFGIEQYKAAWRDIAPVVLERSTRIEIDCLLSLLRTDSSGGKSDEPEVQEARGWQAKNYAVRVTTHLETFAAALDLTQADIEPYTREISRLAFPGEEA